MKINPFILCFVIILGVFVGLNIDTQVNSESSTIKIQDNSDLTRTDLSSEYLISYFKENNFAFSSPKILRNTYMYTGKYKIPNSEVMMFVNIHEEKKFNRVSLIEFALDASYYVTNRTNDLPDMEKQLDQFALNMYVPYASIPYRTSQPDEASKFVNANVTSADSPAKSYTTQIGNGTITLYGTPLTRFMEIDLR